MKKLNSILALFLFIWTNVAALDVSCTYANFNAIDFNYTEIYITVIGSTIDYTPLENDTTNYQGAVDVLLLIKQNDKIIKVEKYNLLSPVTRTTLNFMDLKRFQLEDGEYELELEAVDSNDKTNKMSFKSTFNVGFSNKKVTQSDILLLSSFEKAITESPFVKNGYYLEIAPFNFYHKTAAKLIFYNEIYNTQNLDRKEYLVTYTVERVFGNGTTKSVLVGHKKRNAKKVDVILTKMDISTLGSGNYRLSIAIRDSENNLVSGKQIDFYRSNPLLDQKNSDKIDLTSSSNFTVDMTLEELRYSLKAIAPFFENTETTILNAIISQRKVSSQANYLFTYWARRNPIDPKGAYDEYMEVARAIDNTFKSGFGHGFETDRGRVYLRYGAPSQRQEVLDDPNAVPYEVWSYDEIESLNQTNVNFLFYNNTLATGDYLLLHSNAKGEIRNDDWLEFLYKDAANVPNAGGLEGVLDAFGSNAKDRFRDN